MICTFSKSAISEFVPSVMSRIFVLCSMLWFSMVSVIPVHAQANADQGLTVLTVDASRQLGAFKPVNSVNGGPIINLGNYYDNSAYFASMAPPYVRLHDVPYAHEGTVDIHCIFPDFSADEDDPENYHFAKTDLYIGSILKVGARVIFRLGESIEHGPVKYYIHPPSDMAKWVRICCNIIRHYNMGWADGHHWGIRYWEIWNEPNVAPCWSGTMAQYCKMYESVARAIHELDAALKVGGPALAGPLDSEKGREFIGYCRDHQVPLDFVSWHGYADHPDKLMRNVEESLAMLGENGFKNVETIFGEWNYLPVPWEVSRTERELTRDRFTWTWGAPGAAFTASMLAYLLPSELDIACYYSAYGTVFRFGLFDIFGLPRKPLFTFSAFNRLVECGTRIHVTGNNRETGLGITGAVNMEKQTTAVLLSNFQDESSRYLLDLKNLPASGRIYCDEFVIDETHSLEWEREQILVSSDARMIIELPKATVRLLILSPLPQRKP
jgi:xylan 1,4-beta-xylosidase